MWRPACASFEECGLWLGGTLDHNTAVREAALAALRSGAASFAQVVDLLQLRIEPGCVRPWAHWVTPVEMPKRFDTWFFVARAPAGGPGYAELTRSDDPSTGRTGDAPPAS